MTGWDFRQIQTQTGWGRTLQSFSRWCRPEAGWVTLDAGCGPGLLPALFQELGCRAFGIDLDGAAFVPAPLHPSVVQGRASHLPFASQTFHLVTATNLLFFLDDPAPVLHELRRVTQPGGWVAVLNPSERMSVQAAAVLTSELGLQDAAAESLLNWAARAEAHRRWNPDELRAFFQTADLELVDWEYRIGPGLALFARARRSRS